MQRNNLRKWSFLLGAAVAAGLACGRTGSAHESGSGKDVEHRSHVGNLTGHAKAGAADYRRYCVGCHGELGDGNGENAVWIDPKPRNFQLGIFKCRSTPTGTLPTDEDLVQQYCPRLRSFQHAAMEHLHQAGAR